MWLTSYWLVLTCSVMCCATQWMHCHNKSAVNHPVRHRWPRGSLFHPEDALWPQSVHPAHFHTQRGKLDRYQSPQRHRSQKAALLPVTSWTFWKCSFLLFHCICSAFSVSSNTFSAHPFSQTFPSAWAGSSSPSTEAYHLWKTNAGAKSIFWTLLTFGSASREGSSSETL